MLSVQDLYLSAKKSGLSRLRLEQYRVKVFNSFVTEDSWHATIPVNSYTTKGVVYTVELHFTPVTFITEEEYNRVANAGRDKINGTWYYFIKPSNYSPLQCSCTCMNYVYTWAFPNAKKGVHYGPLPVIEPPKGVRPPRNPQHLPGMCKHIAAALNGTWGSFTRISIPKE